MPRIIALWMAFLLGCIAPGAALADGKFYMAERIPEIPFQRAIIWHDGTHQTLLVQSKYQVADAGRIREFGWVIPVPALPDVGSLRHMSASAIFSALERETRTEVVYVWGEVLFILVVLSVVRLIAASFARALGYAGRYRRLAGGVGGNVALLGALFALWILASTSSPKGMPPPATANAVEVIRESIAGDYEVKVLRSTDAGELLGWLNARQFRFEKSDEQAFADYIRRGWLFVAARLATGNEAATPPATDLVSPLLLQFPSKDPVYPLALTATAGQPTEVVLYVLAESRMDARGRLPVSFAAPTDMSMASLGAAVQPRGLLDGKQFTPRFVTRFHGRMTPEQMREDLVLVRSADPLPHGTHVYTWSRLEYYGALRRVREPFGPHERR